MLYKGSVHYACLAVTLFPKASVKVKSSGGGGTSKSSHEAPHVLCILTGAELAASPSKALCTDGKAETLKIITDFFVSGDRAAPHQAAPSSTCTRQVSWVQH